MFWRITGGGVFFLLAGVASWAGASLADRSPPVTDVKLTVTETSHATPSGSVQVDITVFYRRSCFTHIARELYDSKGHRYALPNYNADPGPLGIQHAPASFQIDSEFAPGEARYVSHPSYACNWMQRFWMIQLPDRVMDFMVFPKPADVTEDKAK